MVEDLMGEGVPPLLGRIRITYEDKAHADSWSGDFSFPPPKGINHQSSSNSLQEYEARP